MNSITTNDLSFLQQVFELMLKNAKEDENLFIEASTVEKTANGHRYSFSMYLKKNQSVPDRRD